MPLPKTASPASTRTGRTLDALIIGGGPAGLAAGIHLARAGYDALLLERGRLGGQAAALKLVENYPGFPGGVPGRELMRSWIAQARRWRLATAAGEAELISRGPGGIFQVRLRGGRALRARAVLWCGGSKFRRLGVPGELELAGKGVWNADWQAGGRARGPAAVIGSGEAAAQQAAQLAGRGLEVLLVSRTGRLKAHRLLMKRFKDSGAALLPGYCVKRFIGKERLEAAELAQQKGGSPLRLPLRSAFVLAGKEPAEAPARWRSEPAGFFRAGDAAAGIYRQVAVAGGDGIRAAMACIRYLEGM